MKALSVLVTTTTMLLLLLPSLLARARAASSFQWGAPAGNRAAGVIVAATNPTNCTCVAASLCNTADVITDGAGQIDLRRTCTVGQVCCTRPTGTATTSPVVGPGGGAAAVGCGLRDPGITSTSFINRITSSTASSEAAQGEFPWMVAVLDGGQFLCGGSLVDERVVLTAAHCVAGKTPAALTARLGEWDASITTETNPSLDMRVAAVVVHPNYYPPGVFHDLATLILSSPADLSKPNIGLACLPEPADTFLLDQCVVAGWGKETFSSPGQAARLRKIRVPVVEHRACQARLQADRLGSRFRLHQSFLCAGGEAGQDACTGDGGGPLVCPLAGEPARQIQVGVVSWGLGCGRAVPGVYAALQTDTDWVLDTVANYQGVRAALQQVWG